MALLPFFRMTALQAARFREETAGDQNRLEPIQGRNPGGTQYWYLPERVVTDPEHEQRHDALRMLDVIAIDPEVVFPPTPEERAAAAADKG